MPFNLLVTAHRFESREAERQLRELAGVELRRTSFRDVLVGEAPDPLKALESLARAATGSAAPGAPALLPAFARVVPLDESFEFAPETLLSSLKERLPRYAERIPSGSSFALRFERRGFKGKLKSQDVERDLAEHLYRLLDAQGKSPRVDLEDPDALVVIELVGNECASGLLPRELRERFPFVRAR
jgi:tRNA(Ser,Leu) C12 N-acetylase TAN1